MLVGTQLQLDLLEAVKRECFGRHTRGIFLSNLPGLSVSAIAHVFATGRGLKGNKRVPAHPLVGSFHDISPR